jgi:PAS domain S-box-containing protein/putative nucleotidyltransferase with HDIG domain
MPKSNRKSRGVLDTILEGCQIIGFDWCYLYVNDAAARHGRRIKDDLLGHTMMEIYPGIENTEMFAKLRRCMEKRTSHRMENEFIFPDGGKGWFELSIQPVPEGVLILSWDITKHKQIEKALRESEGRFRQLADRAADVIWTVDMNMRPTYINPSITRLLDYSVNEAMSMKMEEIFTPHSFKVAMKTFAEELAMENKEDDDLARPHTMEFELRHKNGSIVPVEVSYSALRDAGTRPLEILAIVRDISGRKQAQMKTKRNTDILLKAMENTIQAIAMIAEMRDPYTAGHQRRVALLACAIAKKLGFSEDQINALRLAALVHDIGKARVPVEILTHPDGLTEAEFSMIKAHPTIGYEILQKIDLPWPIAQMVYQHHERLDGSGYPSGLSGDNIIMEARILAVADVVEAMASHRPYRPARGKVNALSEIAEKKGILYDPRVVDACEKLFKEEGFSF